MRIEILNPEKTGSQCLVWRVKRSQKTGSQSLMWRVRETVGYYGVWHA